jgi:hypothetical protein
MADIGTGATFAFGTTPIALAFTSIEASGVTRESLDVSDLSTTGAKAFIASKLYDAGEITFEGLLDPNLGDALVTKVGAAAESMTVTFPIPSGGAAGSTFVATGFLTSFEWGVPIEEEMTFSMTVKLTGEITWTDSS